jgi:hypothetical protein
MVFTFSWLYNGGSPHGLDPSPGWVNLRPVLRWLFVAGAVLAVFGKGRLRLLLVAWAPSLILALFATFALEMD